MTTHFPVSEPAPVGGCANRWSGSASFTGEEPFFRDHFPGRPLVPGVLFVEILRSLAEKVLCRNHGTVRLAEASRVRFIQPASPPVRLEALVEIDPQDSLMVKAELSVDGFGRVASAVLRFEPEEGAG